MVICHLEKSVKLGIYKGFSLFLAILGFGVISAVAQPTIGTTSMPKSGDTLRYSNASPTQLPSNWKTGGASQSWDFSSLTSTSQGLYEYLAASKTPYAFYFFSQIGQKTADTIAIGPVTLTNVYSFYTSNSSAFKATGIGYSVSGFPLSANYSDADEIYQFPLNYNDKDTSTFKFTLSLPGNLFTVVQTGTRVNYADGYGSIKTPYNTYSNALRVVTVVDQIDTIVSQLGKFAIPRKTVSYKWLVTTEKIPVLEVQGQQLPNGTFQATQVLYRDKYLTVAGPPAPIAEFTCDKDSGLVSVDTFTLVDVTQDLIASRTWTVTPSSGVVFAGGTSNTSRRAKLLFNNSGLYSVKLSVSTATGGKDDTTGQDIIFVYYGLGTQQLQAVKVQQLYPNPVENELQLRFTFPQSVEVAEQNSVEVEVMDLNGKLITLNTKYLTMVSERSGDSGFGLTGSVQLDVSALSSSVYWLRSVNFTTISGEKITVTMPENQVFVKK